MRLTLRSRMNFASAADGNVSILFAFALIPGAMIAGAAIDISSAMTTRSRAQAAADAAVIAANSLPATATIDQRTLTATNVYSANKGAGTPTVTATSDTVAVSVSTTVPTTLLRLAHIDGITVDALAQASAKSTTPSSPETGKVCLLALDPASTDGIHVQGNNSIDYSGCWGYTNANTATAINANGSQATVVGAGHCAVGGYDASYANFSPAPKTKCDVMPDPFANVGAYASQSYSPKFTPPTLPSSCTSTNLKLKKGAYTLSPGRYCGGIDMSAQATVTFNPGIYFIDSGVLNVQSGASINGSNVLFYMSGSNATMTVIGGGTVDMHGRNSSSSYAGFLVIQDPNAARGSTSNIQGGGSFTMDGMVYMPTQRIEVSGNGDVNANTPMFAMVAKDFYFRGNGTFRLRAATGSQTAKDIVPDLPPQAVRSVALTK